MSQEIKSQRMNYIDAARGVAILLVMIGHAAIPTTLRVYIYSFHLPLFFIISGMFINEKKRPKQYVIEKIKNLLIPYFFWSLVWLIFRLVLNAVAELIQFETDNKFDLFDSSVGIFLCMRQGKYGGYLWFLLAIFGTLILTKLILNSKYKMQLLGILLIIEVLYLYLGKGFNVPFCLDVIPVTCIFSFCGIWWKKNTDKVSKNFLFAVILFLIHIVTMIFNQCFFGITDMYTRNYGNLAFFFVAGISGSFSLLFILKYLYGKVPSTIWLLRMLEKIGQNTLILYVLHTMIYIILRNVGKLFTSLLNVGIFECILNNWIVQFLLSLLIILLFNRFIIKYFPWMVGKKKRTL